jgi:hypothetical protein
VAYDSWDMFMYVIHQHQQINNQFEKKKTLLVQRGSRLMWLVGRISKQIVDRRLILGSSWRCNGTPFCAGVEFLLNLPPNMYTLSFCNHQIKRQTTPCLLVLSFLCASIAAKYGASSASGHPAKLIWSYLTKGELHQAGLGHVSRPAWYTINQKETIIVAGAKIACISCNT